MIHLTLAFLIAAAYGFVLAIRLVVGFRCLTKWEKTFCWSLIVAWLAATCHVVFVAAHALS